MHARIAMALTTWIVGFTVAGPAAEPTDSPPDAKASVRMIVDFGDGFQKQYSTVPWREGLTVLDALQWCTRHARGITVKARGSGATAFVSQIDDLANEGTGRNWVFRINGAIGTRSCGIATVKAGDAILWKFEEYH